MIFVISSDTLVETPVIVDYIDNTLNRINEAAKIHGMPFQAEKVMPLMEEQFLDQPHWPRLSRTHNNISLVYRANEN